MISFDYLAARASHVTGTPLASAVAFGVVVAWAVSGPIFRFSNTWQLVINTGTTVVTFLMVFLLQHAQDRDTKAIQRKLDELVKATDKASNEVVGIENPEKRS